MRTLETKDSPLDIKHRLISTSTKINDSWSSTSDKNESAYPSPSKTKVKQPIS